ncbi:hypothetical protein LOD99_2888 [Oopsacas minuta]|uniref:Methyltransferase domain-containing protein n=1 Tax=Oopsacas minuta TaxID=111878 RepID=A0AAV7K1A0_9METZ|nr:hypothetical protein LOD99_2888 [Oopsacas minuta]
MAKAKYHGKLTFEERETEFIEYIRSRDENSAERKDGREVQEFYDHNAQDYEKFLQNVGSVSYIYGAREFAKRLKGKRLPTDVKIADFGAGTGRVGQELKEQHGYTNIVAMDISPGMLDEAKKKDAYNDFIVSDLNEDNMEKYYKQFDHAISIACFVLGNLLPDTLDKIARIVKSGGLVCISFRKQTIESEEIGYKQKLEEMETKGVWKEISRALDYYQQFVPTREGTKTVRAYYIVFQSSAIL